MLDIKKAVLYVRKVPQKFVLERCYFVERAKCVAVVVVVEV